MHILIRRPQPTASAWHYRRMQPDRTPTLPPVMYRQHSWRPVSLRTRSAGRAGMGPGRGCTGEATSRRKQFVPGQRTDAPTASHGRRRPVSAPCAQPRFGCVDPSCATLRRPTRYGPSDPPRGRRRPDRPWPRRARRRTATSRSVVPQWHSAHECRSDIDRLCLLGVIRVGSCRRRQCAVPRNSHPARVVGSADPNQTSPRCRCRPSGVVFADGRSESPGESRLRLDMHRAGLPVPVLQVCVYAVDGTFLGRVTSVTRNWGC